jgi:hypothetical protein
MNSDEESNAPISIGNALTEEIISNYGVSVNVRQEFIVTTEDKLRLCLHAHLENVEKRKDWWTPAGLFFAILTTLVTTSTFKNIGLKATEWRALFIFTGVGAFDIHCYSSDPLRFKRNRIYCE